jgi:hypothetical protein
MLDEAGFEVLRRPLETLRPAFDRFCKEQGFEYVNPLALGRYPRIRVAKPSEIQLWLDLWMELDADGKRFEVLRDDLPYELSAGAYIDCSDESGSKSRLQHMVSCFRGKSIREMTSDLSAELDRAFRLIRAWDRPFLEEHGKRIPLRA